MALLQQVSIPATLDELKRQLDARWAAALGKETLKTECLSWNGQNFIVKYRNLEAVRQAYSWLASFACFLFFGLRVRPSRLRAGGLEFEARRLRALAEAQAGVPHLLLETPDYLLLEYCGKDLVSCLQTASQAQRLQWIGQAVQLLADFHRKGLWHGGAQLRNLTVCTEPVFRLTRIDFEETAGEVLPLPLMQAYDVLLCLHSASDYLDLSTSSAEELLQGYLRQTANPELARILLRLEGFTAFLLWLAPCLSARARNRKDMLRSLQLARLLRNMKPVLQRSSREPQQ